MRKRKKYIRLVRLAYVVVCLLFAHNMTAAHPVQPPIDIPAPAQVILDKAEKLAVKGKVAAAIQRLEAFRAKGKQPLAPGKVDRKGYCHFLVDFHLGNYQMMSDDLQAALIEYERTVEKSPAFSPGWFNLAKAAYDLRQYEKAAQAFVRAYDTAAQARPEWLYYAGASLMSAEKTIEALSLFRRLTKACDGKLEPSWREALVQLLLEAAQPREALSHMEILCRETQGDRRKRWQETLLYQYMAMEMNGKARGLIRDLTRQYPTEPKWWKGLAHFHLSRNQEKQALAALIIYGYLAEPTYGEKRLIADLYLSLGIPTSAAAGYREIAGDAPDKVLIKRLIHALCWLKQWDEALFWAARGSEITADPEFHFIQGTLHYEKGHYAEAATAFRTAAKDPRYAGRAWLMVAYCAWYEGNLPAAREAVERAGRFKEQKKEAARLSALIDQQSRIPAAKHQEL